MVNSVSWCSQCSGGGHIPISNVQIFHGVFKAGAVIHWWRRSYSNFTADWALRCHKGPVLIPSLLQNFSVCPDLQINLKFTSQIATEGLPLTKSSKLHLKIIHLDFKKSISD